MAFELPALPSFQVQIPDLQQKALEGAQLKNMLSEMALRKALAPLQIQQAQQGVQQGQQQVQAATTENELKTMQLQGQRAMTDWLANGDANADVPAENFSHNDRIATFVGVTPNDPIMNVVRSMAQHHVPAPMLVTEAQGMLQRRNEYFKGTKEEQDAQKNERLIWQDALASIHEAPPDQRGPLLAAKLPLLQENSKTDPLLDAYAKGLAGHPELIDQAYNTLSAENAALGLRKAKAETTEAEQKQQQEKINPQTGLSPQMQAEAQKTISVETNPQVQAGKVAVAKAEALAREQVQAQMLPLLEQIRQQFANQKDARDKIETTVLKPFQDKMTDVQMARTAIEQAADNPVAARAAIFKMVGVAQPTGSHRVLPMEFAAFKYPGGITDQIKQKFNDFLKGEPWTPEIAQAANSFIEGQAEAVQRNLSAGIDNVNATYNTNVGTGLKQTTAAQVPTGPLPSGKSVSLAAARALPQNKGKSDAEIRADIEKYGHKVSE